MCKGIEVPYGRWDWLFAAMVFVGVTIVLNAGGC
jgi:hypothetical protein